jgi:hypothetical protein
MSTTPNGDATNGSIERLNDAGEHSPLLPKPAGDAAETTDDAGNGQTRTYNKTQVIILACVRMVDPIAFFCIVPFVNQMIFDTGKVPEQDVGFYSGLIVRRHPRAVVASSLTSTGVGIALFAGSDVHHAALGTGQRPVRPQTRARDVAGRAGLHGVLVRVQPERLADDRAEVCGRPLLRSCCVGRSRFGFCFSVCPSEFSRV